MYVFLTIHCGRGRRRRRLRFDRAGRHGRNGRRPCHRRAVLLIARHQHHRRTGDGARRQRRRGRRHRLAFRRLRDDAGSRQMMGELGAGQRLAVRRRRRFAGHVQRRFGRRRRSAIRFAQRSNGAGGGGCSGGGGCRCGRTGLVVFGGEANATIATPFGCGQLLGGQTGFGCGIGRWRERDAGLDLELFE